MLDLDGLFVADPAADVANLMAHLVLRALQRGDDPDRRRDQGRRLLTSYHAAGGSADPDAVDAAVARALFRLACVYLFRGRWHALAPLLLHQSGQASRLMTPRLGGTSP